MKTIYVGYMYLLLSNKEHHRYYILELNFFLVKPTGKVTRMAGIICEFPIVEVQVNAVAFPQLQYRSEGSSGLIGFGEGQSHANLVQPKRNIKVAIIRRHSRKLEIVNAFRGSRENAGRQVYVVPNVHSRGCPRNHRTGSIKWRVSLDVEIG